MAHPAPSYSELESKILVTIYENPNVPITSIWLAQSFYPNVEIGTQDFRKPLEDVVSATERLIVKGLVDGTVTKMPPSQIYFTDIKLKYKGKQQAILERQRTAEFEKELPKIREEANKVAAEMNSSQTKK